MRLISTSAFFFCPPLKQRLLSFDCSNQTLDVDIPFFIPNRGLTMLNYNPIDGRLYFFDAGKMLSVNVGIVEVSDDTTDEPLAPPL